MPVTGWVECSFSASVDARYAPADAITSGGLVATGFMCGDDELVGTGVTWDDWWWIEERIVIRPR